jgi:outer membrane protein TolC
MGVPESEAIELADARMPRIDDTELEPLDQALIAAAELRPEWHQVRHGREAALALEKAERLAMAPVLFVAGQIRAAWAPTRDDADSPYVYDPFNDLFGGIALGLQFNIDPAHALAKAEQAEALQAEIEALARFAATGIPLRVKKAHDEATRFRESAGIARSGVKAAQKWMTFSGAAYATGTGEAEDLLEGLVAWLQAKEAYYSVVRDYFVGRAELDFAIGR